MKKQCKVMIFDLDGTLADTIDTITYYCNRALDKFGFAPIDKERYKYLVGNGYKVLVKGMLDEYNAYEEKLFNEMAEYYHDDYETDSLYLTKLFDGMEELISTLKQRGIKVAVFSNKPHGAVKDVIDAFFPENTFDVCQGQNGTFPLKPAPDGVIKIMEEMGVTKEETIYVGDTSTDMITGKSAGVFTIGCEWGFRTKDELIETGADLIVKHPLDIIKFLDED